MNYKTWLLPFVSFLASICCQARSIQHPSYLLGSPGLSNSKLERIEIGKKTTALIFALNAFEDQITLPGNVYLTAAGDSLPLLSAVAYRHRCDEDSARQVTKGENFAFQEGDSLRLVSPACHTKPPLSTIFASTIGIRGKCWASALTVFLTHPFFLLRRRFA